MYQIECCDPIIHTSASPVCTDASCPCHDEWFDKSNIEDPAVQSWLLAINEARNQADRETSEFYRINAEAQ